MKALYNIVLVNWSIPARVELKRRNLEVTEETKDVTKRKKETNIKQGRNGEEHNVK